MSDRTVDAMAMARTVKRARGALIDAVRHGLHGDERSALRTVHAQVFENLDPDGTRLTVLAERAQMSHQSMGELVSDLVRHDYVERVPDPMDRRARLIRPTAAGHAELARAAAHLRLIHERWERQLKGLTASQVIEALDILIHVCELPKDGAQGSSPDAQ